MDVHWVTPASNDLDSSVNRRVALQEVDLESEYPLEEVSARSNVRDREHWLYTMELVLSTEPLVSPFDGHALLGVAA